MAAIAAHGHPSPADATGRDLVADHLSPLPDIAGVSVSSVCNLVSFDGRRADSAPPRPRKSTGLPFDEAADRLRPPARDGRESKSRPSDRDWSGYCQSIATPCNVVADK